MSKQVTPCGEFDCQSFPLVEGKIYNITDEELEKLGNHELKWSEDSEGHPILIANDPTEENRIRNAENRINELKQYLASTDYEAIKFAEGELSAEDYAPFKAQRAAARAEINQLEAILL